MNLRIVGTLFVSITSIGVTSLVACGDDTSTPGPAGPAGPAGIAGPAGPPGERGPAADAGGVFTGACTAPCHTFSGVVDQWRSTGHAHPQNTEIGGGACGNCHGIDGIQQRRANVFANVGAAPAPMNVANGHLNYLTATNAVAEIGYGGATTIGRIQCATCHDFNSTNDPHVTGRYTAGQAPIRVAGGPNDVAYLEKTPDGGVPTGQPVSLGAANLCVFCHKSRKDVALYIGASNNLSSRWGPHDGPQADIFTGKGGHHFPGKVYGSTPHVTIANACVACHMAPNPANNNVPDHSMKPNLGYCKTCHTTYTGATFDIQSGQTVMKAGLRELQAELNAKGYLTRSSGALTAEELADDQFHLDVPRSGAVDAPTAGALYNYLLVARGKDFGVHNPTYVKQLLFDSILQVKGSTPTSLSRPPS